MRFRGRFRLSCLAACALPLLAGCDVGYLLHITLGQIAVTARVVPIAQALNDPNLTEEEKAKLGLVLHVRQFGIDRIGLKATEAYTLFDPNGPAPAAFVVSASQKHGLIAYRWELPLVGGIGTKGFFEEGFARGEADSLKSQGYDVFLGRAAGFSTLGFFPDPVRQSNLRMDDVELVELILHEMTHTTIFKPPDSNFNEGLATFIGRVATQTYFDEVYGADSTQAVAARTRDADKSVMDGYVNALYGTMAAYYSAAAGRGETIEQIVAGRQVHFDALQARYRDEFEPRLLDPEHWAFNREVEMNNARILAAIVYQGSLDVFKGVFTKVGGSFSDALAIFAEAAAQEDSFAFLRAFGQGP